MVSSTLLPSSCSSSVSPRTTTGSTRTNMTPTNSNRSRRSTPQPLGQQQQLCPKPNSKSQWIITSLFVGTFMFFLTRNQSIDRQQQQHQQGSLVASQHRQASILPSSNNDKVNLGSILTNNVYGKKDSQLNVLTTSTTDVIKTSRNDDDDIDDGEDDDDIQIEKNTEENDNNNDDDDDDDDKNDNEHDDDEVSVDNTNDNSAQETTTVKMNSLQKLSIHAERIVSETNRRPIKQISLLGERNSGTRWTFEHLSNCFNHSIIVRRRLTRYKHWFQYDDPSQYSHDTLVIAQFRNPYEWLKAMEHVPHHSPAHLKSVLLNDKHTIQQYLQEKLNAGRTGSNIVPTLENWELFLTKSWTTERVGIDLDIIKNNDTSTVICQENFNFNDIVSCVIEPLPKKSYTRKIQFSEHQPFYEMNNDHSGIPYNNIMDMRTDKIRNFMYDVKNYKGITDVWSVQYEDLVSYGTELLLQNIQKVTGIVPQCVPKQSQQRFTKPSRIITHQYANFINQHLNWTIEEMIGYTQRI